MARSWRLMVNSWDFLRGRPALFVFPAIGAVATTIAAIVIFVPVLWLTRDLDFKLSMFVASVAGALPLTVISTVCNVAFLSMTLAYERGERPTARDGWREAMARFPQVLGWSLLAAVVGVVISGLQRLPGGEWLANLLGFLGGLAWGLATFFVMPVLVLERTGPVESIRRSARTFRDRWGEALTADIGIGFVFGLLTVPGFLTACAGGALLAEGDLAAGTGLMALGLALVVPLIVLSSALTELFTLHLYRYSHGIAPGGPFTEHDFRTAIERKKPPWWRR